MKCGYKVKTLLLICAHGMDLGVITEVSKGSIIAIIVQFPESYFEGQQPFTKLFFLNCKRTKTY